ncbi:MAG: sulfatase [Planctomycetaceae bacterium]|nr:sulfatase [Planctomycetaceae bacterium]
MLARWLFVACLMPTILSAAERPNIVVFICDDLGAEDTQPYGSTEARTPHLVQLASEGTRFTHCFVASPSCGPSRTALLTGLMPARNGAEPNHTPKRAGVASLPPVLHALGYEVAAFGKVAHGNHAPLHGFDVFHADSSAERVGTFLRERDAKKPLCLFLGTRHPHVPWSANDGYDSTKVTPPPMHVDTSETRAMRTQYLTDVTNADRWLGELRPLVREHVAGETLTIFTSDHGAQWPFGKWNLYDAGIRIPLIAVWPGRIKPNTTNPAMVQWVDLLPTFIDLAGGQVPEGLDGRSFAAVLKGATTDHRDRIFTTHSGDGYRMNVYPIRSVRTRDWKYIRNLHPEFQHHSHISRAAGKDGLIYWTSWLRATEQTLEATAIVMRHMQRPREELYDLIADSFELHNLAPVTAHADRLTAMRAELDGWMTSQGDQQTVFGKPTLLGEPALPLTPEENRPPANAGR